jgi:glycosyltransferase involved in cell wall biosynthesis
MMMPIHYMNKEKAIVTDKLNDDLLETGFDIVVINRFLPYNTIDELIAAREKYGFKLVVDVDDYWVLDEWHILKHQYPTQRIIDHIKIADMVTCTNMGLRYYISSINENVHVIPNALPFGRDQFTDVHVPSDLVRVVYAGSITHEKDIAILKNPFKRVLGDKSLVSNLHFTICGYSETNPFTKKVWQRMVSDFTVGLQLPGAVKPALNVYEYMNFYNEADISIVPLVPSRFNAMKSNLKVLEAAAKKIPVLVSNTAPYDGCKHAIKVSNQTEWYKNIKKLGTDAIYRKEMGEKNFEWCNEYFHLDKINVLREQLYRSLL